MGKDKGKARGKSLLSAKEVSKEDIINILKTGDRDKIEEALKRWYEQEHFYSDNLPF